MASAVLRVRTDRGEESLDLDEFEGRVVRGEIAPQCPVQFPPVTGERWVAAGSLEIFRHLYSPRRLHFSRAFTLGGVPWVTLSFLGLNVVWFLAMRLWGPPDPSDAMLAFGAKAGPLMLDLGQFWRLLSANVVHRDALHIAVNLFVIFNFAGALENAFRPLDMLLILVASALGTTLCSFAVTDPVSAGASGVAYGALGGAVLFGLRHRAILPARYRLALGGAVLPTVLVFLFIGWTSNGVDNWGHLGGLLAGGATTAILRPRLLSDSPTLGPLLFRRGLPLLILFGGPLILGPATRRWLPHLTDRTDSELGLRIALPSEWARGADSLGRMAFFNGLGGYGHAQLSIGGFLSTEGPPDLVAAAGAFTRRVSEGAQRQGAEVHFESPVPATLAGLGGMRLEGRSQSPGEELRRIEGWILARGRLCYEVEIVWPEAMPDYRRLLDRILKSLTLEEPEALERARARLLFVPADRAARSELVDIDRALGGAAESP